MVNHMQPFIPVSFLGLVLDTPFCCVSHPLVETNASPFYLMSVVLWNTVTFFFVVVLFFLTETDISPRG